MLLETALLTICLSFGFGVAILMVRRIKSDSSLPTVEGVNLEHLIKKITKSMGEEIAAAIKEALKDVNIRAGSSSSLQNNKSNISIDEGLIPMKIQQEEVEANLDNMAKTETKSDAGLDKSKSKLASVLKKRKNK